MVLHKPIRLTFELLSDEEIDQYSIYSKREIQFILKSIAKYGGQVALYYGNRENFILSTLLDADHNGLWIEASQNAALNDQITRRDRFYFVGAQQNVKVQFEADEIETDEYDGLSAFYIPLPDSLLRIQRREHFRLGTPIANPLKCIVQTDPEQPDSKREFPILDISSGGLALACAETDTALAEGSIYKNCRIHLPEGSIAVDLQVRNIFLISKPSGAAMKRVGCQFVNIDGKTEMLLQRYITQLQKNSIQAK